MSLEPFIAFFVVWRLRKNLKNLSPDAWWNKILTWVLIGIGILFALDLALPVEIVTKWIWHLLILGIAYASFRLPIFERMRTVIKAVLPLIIISLFSDLLEDLLFGYYKEIENYIEFALVIAITWMIAMLIKSNKQDKALEKERNKWVQEEERNKYISAQKEKLELIVAERTTEITKQKDELMKAFTELKNTQTQLIHSEKMASLGELTAGIAHEIQNPLNFVNNFSELNAELIEELKTELIAGNTEEAVVIAKDISDNEKKINFHGKRADAIVKGMLQHSRSSSAVKEPTNINTLADEYLRLAYHGLRAKNKSFNAIMNTDYDDKLQPVNAVPQDIGRVILNLITNAFYATTEKAKMNIENYEPTVTIITSLIPPSNGGGASIVVKDNGNGIPKNVIDKIFQPFFTTKPTGHGTGLGLSMSYEIITQGHGGELKVETNEGQGTSFTIILPK